MLPLAAQAGLRQTPRAPRYDDRVLSGLDVSREATPDKLRDRLRVLSKVRGVRTLQRRSTDGSVQAVAIGNLTTPEVLGAIAALGYELRGSENDLFITGLDGKTYPVSTWWDEPRVVTVQAGPAWEEQLDARLTADTVRQRYDLQALVEGDRAWDGRGLQLLDRALSMLSPQELARVRSVPIHRKRKPSAEIIESLKAVPAAAYVHDQQGPRFELYNAAVKTTGRFSGTPDQAHRYSLSVILHELGHAIAHAERREARIQVEAMIARQQELFNSSTQAHARLKRQADAIRSPADAEAFEAAVATFEAGRAENDALVARIDTEAPRLNALLGTPTAAARDLQAVLGKAGPPTYYGLTDPDEAFADCYAMFKADPEALTRTRPTAYAWFLGGGHLKAVDPPAQ